MIDQEKAEKFATMLIHTAGCLRYKAAWIANLAGGCEWGWCCSYWGMQLQWEELTDQCPRCKSEMSLPKTTYEIEDVNNVYPYSHMCKQALLINIQNLYQLPYKIFDSRITDEHRIEPLWIDRWEPYGVMDQKVIKGNLELKSYNGCLEIKGDIDGCTDMKFVIGVEQ